MPCISQRRLGYYLVENTSYLDMEQQHFPSYCYPATGNVSSAPPAIDATDDSDMLLQLEAFLLGTDDAEPAAEAVSSDWSSSSWTRGHPPPQLPQMWER